MYYRLSTIDDTIERKKARLELSHQLFEDSQRLAIDAVACAWAIERALNQSRFLEHLEVLAHSRLGERYLLHNIAAHAGVQRAEIVQDLHAGWMRQRLAEARELLASRFCPLGNLHAFFWLAIVDHIFALLHRKITMKSIRERAMLIKNWQAVLLIAPMQLHYLSPFPLYM